MMIYYLNLLYIIILESDKENGEKKVKRRVLSACLLSVSVLGTSRQ